MPPDRRTDARGALVLVSLVWSSDPRLRVAVVQPAHAGGHLGVAVEIRPGIDQVDQGVEVLVLPQQPLGREVGAWSSGAPIIPTTVPFLTITCNPSETIPSHTDEKSFGGELTFILVLHMFARTGWVRQGGRQMEGVLATGITRRDFLRYATTAATAVGALSLAGCGSQRASEATTGSATSTSAAALFNYALNESPQALDPALVNDFGSLELCANIYEGLFRFKGETCDVEPCLAESYDVSDDGLTYTFKLREGVTFHDGTAFDASAVVTNFERQMNGNAAANMSYADFVFGSDATGVGVKSVEATDAYTVTCTMRSPCAPFLRNLAMALGTPMVSPTALAKANGDMSSAPCGTGPYQLDSWDKDSTVTLKAFDGYWDKDNAPQTETIVFRIIPESASRVTALSNNEADIITAVETNSAPTVQNDGDTVVAIDGLNVNYLCLNMTSAKLADIAVRTAVCQAIDIEEMVKALYGDYADVGKLAHALRSWPSTSRNVSYPSYDPDCGAGCLLQGRSHRSLSP